MFFLLPLFKGYKNNASIYVFVLLTHCMSLDVTLSLKLFETLSYTESGLWRASFIKNKVFPCAFHVAINDTLFQGCSCWDNFQTVLSMNISKVLCSLQANGGAAVIGWSWIRMRDCHHSFHTHMLTALVSSDAIVTIVKRKDSSSDLHKILTACCTLSLVFSK